MGNTIQTLETETDLSLDSESDFATIKVAICLLGLFAEPALDRALLEVCVGSHWGLQCWVP